jgi:tripartite motif-containing protein 71
MGGIHMLRHSFVVRFGGGQLIGTPRNGCFKRPWLIAAIPAIVLLCSGRNALADYAYNKSINLPSSIDGAAGVAVDSSDDIWVADTGNARIREYTNAGTLIQTIGTTGSGNGQFARPYDLGVDPSGNVWVIDAVNNNLQEFASDGTFVRSVGSLGTGPGQFDFDRGLAVDASGNVWVAGNQRIEEFNNSGNFVQQISGYYPLRIGGRSELLDPLDVTIDPFGNVWVSEFQSNKVVELSATGTYIKSISLYYPLGITSDATGNIWFFASGMEEFSNAGSLIQSFPFNPNLPAGEPSGLAVDSLENVWVTQFQSNGRANRIDEYSPVPEPSTFVLGVLAALMLGALRLRF